MKLKKTFLYKIGYFLRKNMEKIRLVTVFKNTKNTILVLFSSYSLNLVFLKSLEGK